MEHTTRVAAFRFPQTQSRLNIVDNLAISGETPLRTVVSSLCAAMPPHPMSGPDQSLPSPSASGTFRAQLDDASFETDLVDLANRFSSQSGGGLPPELSADLALEIVLNEIVEQACLATGATGAAVVLKRDEEMVCRASSGTNAPALGVRMDISSGLSGECVKTRQLQRSDDLTNDSRVDAEASKVLGIRSAMLMPLLSDGNLIGVFEIFSSQPNAFGERDEMTLDALARRTLSNLKRAAEPIKTGPPVPEGSEINATTPEFLASAEAESEEAVVAVAEIPPRRFDFLNAGLWVAVLLCALLLGAALTRHFEFRRASAHASHVPVATQSATLPVTPIGASNGRSPEQQNVVARVNSNSRVAPGGLSVFENDKEVFHLAPKPASSDAQGNPLRHASAVEPDATVHLAPSVAEGSLVRRVEPIYPVDALRQGIQGAVVLNVRIASNGAVENVEPLSGPPILAQASSDAVKQWRFRTRSVNGHPAQMETRVTLNFRLPQAN